MNELRFQRRETHIHDPDGVGFSVSFRMILQYYDIADSTWKDVPAVNEYEMPIEQDS